MKVLVACEFSGVVRRAFREEGHEAYSCDLLPSEDNSPFHIKADCKKAIEMPFHKINDEGEYLNYDVHHTARRFIHWDLIIMHPPCTHLAVSGNRWYGVGKPQHHKRIESIAWTMDLFELAKARSKYVCMENPVGVLPIKPTQYIQPYEYGHAESKKTGLWLHNLPKLTPTNIVNKPDTGYWDNQTPSGQNKLGPSPDRWKKRSITYEGIANAMVSQWGTFIKGGHFDIW